MSPKKPPQNLNESQTFNLSRRGFLATSGAIASSLACATIIRGEGPNPEVIIGNKDYQYRVLHAWPQLPDQYHWQTTHGVAVDNAQNLYVIHQGKLELKDHPSIFVFDAEGKFIRGFGQQFQGGGHGIDIREENGEEFLYVCGYRHIKSFAKLTLSGEVVWQRKAPMESGVYAADEAGEPNGKGGRNRFLPTNFAFQPDGSFFLADGYGSFIIHHYDNNGNWLNCFGGAGAGEGKFDLPHGLWTDLRSDQPSLIVADRVHNSLQFLNLDGTHMHTLPGFGLPANIDIREDLVLVPELTARVTILDRDNKVAVHLGDDVERITADTERKVRQTESQWQPGKFVHPHDACFTANGDIFVAEWVDTGRITKLIRI